MLKKIDPTNPILVAYLKTINPSVETGVLLLRTYDGSSKKSKKSKKENEKIYLKESLKKILEKSPKKVSSEKEKVLKRDDKQVAVPKVVSSKEIMPSK